MTGSYRAEVAEASDPGVVDGARRAPCVPDRPRADPGPWHCPVLLIVLFSIEAQGFATLDNLDDLLRDVSILGILAIGQTFVLIGGGSISRSAPGC